MGHVPVLPRPRSAHEFLAGHERELRRKIERGRGSRFAWRRRDAHEAVQALIKAREAVIGWRPDPWEISAPPAPARPAEPTYTQG